MRNLKKENKGIIFDIKKFAIHDGPGIRTTVFFKGCPLNCWWCQNPESINIVDDIEINLASVGLGNLKQYNANDLLNEIKKDLLFYDESEGGVTFSGGEPLLQIEFVLEFLKVLKDEFIHTAIDTSGYVNPDYFTRINEYVNLYLFDLKLFNDTLHQKYTGVSNKLIKNNLEYLNSIHSNIIVRIPLIPNVTDTVENLSAISHYLHKLKNVTRVDLLPYNKISEDKYKRLNLKAKLGELETQTVDKLDEIKNFVKSFGINAQLNG